MGTILGRSPNLILALVAAALNAAVLLGLNVDAEQVVALNALAFAIVAVIANTAAIQIAAGDAAKARKK